MNTAYTPYRTTQRVAIRRLVLVLVVGLLALGCGEESDLSDEEADLSNDEHSQICEQINAGMGLHDGYDVPGIAGAPRWGLPETTPPIRRVRRSWSTLSDVEKTQVIDAFIALKNITVDSGDPGSARADYDSFCDELGLESYERNLYDYYVEAHVNAVNGISYTLDAGEVVSCVQALKQRRQDDHATVHRQRHVRDERAEGIGYRLQSLYCGHGIAHSLIHAPQAIDDEAHEAKLISTEQSGTQRIKLP